MLMSHNISLVGLSLIIAIQASYVGLSLSIRVPEAGGSFRRLLLAGAALSLATGIWGMHFVGMLALNLPFNVDFMVLPTLLSFLACVLVVAVALVGASLWPLTRDTLAATAIIMGSGISLMHYLGMSALHAAAHLAHDPFFVAASIALGIIASGFALWLAFSEARRPPLYISAITLGMAISGMHYVAMAGLTLHPLAESSVSGVPAFSTDMLAVIVAVVAFIVSGLFILTLIPDRRTPIPDADSAANQPKRDLDPDRRAKESPNSGTLTGRAFVLPIERDGIAQTIDVSDIVAVHANSHYTYVSNGTTNLFCSLSITEVEEILNPEVFMRVHRSHIINLGHISVIRKSIDSGIAEMAGPLRQSVPVSRTKLAELKKRASERKSHAAQ
jgi:NO-binding membrane sensor protein with MHYT domain